MLYSNIKSSGVKIFIIAVSLFAISVAPASAQATGLTNASVAVIIGRMIDWLLSITAGLAILFIIIGGVYYVTSAGDDEKITTAKKIITYSVIGLVFVLISYSIVKTVNSIIVSGVSSVPAPAAPGSLPVAPVAPASPVLTKIIVAPPLASLAINGTQIFTAFPQDQFNNTITAAITWSSANSSIGTINPTTGVFSALAVGTTTVTAASGTKSGTATVTVVAAAAPPAAAPVLTSITITPNNPSLTNTGTQTFTAIPKDQFGNPITAAVIWSNTKPDLGTIDSISGVFTAKAAGKLTVIATSGAISGATNVTIISTP